MMVAVDHVDQLEELSSWRRFRAGYKELELMEAPKSVLREYEFKSARTCFLAFANIMLDGNLKVAPFHEIIAANFEDVADGCLKRLIVSCPPRSGKSMLSQLFVAWLLGRDQQTQHIIASYGAQLSGRFHRGITGYLKHKNFGNIFPEWKGFEPDSKYDMRGGGYILATSIGGVLTGFTAGSTSENSPGVGAIVVDDPLKSSDSRAAIEGLETWWGEQASTRRTNRWAQILIGTRFHERDLHGVLMGNDGMFDPESNPDGWHWINIPGLCEDEENDPLGRKIGESHWPENPVFAVDMLKSQRKAMGSNAFAALYQGQPKAQEGAIIKSSWIDIIQPEEAPEFDFHYFAMDTAFSEKESADESCIAVMGYSKKTPEDIYVVELIHGRWAFPDLLAWVRQSADFYRPKHMCIEQAASGQSLIQVLERESKIHLHKFKPLRSKTIRLQTVSPLFESGRIHFIDGEWCAPFCKELTSFPHTLHDDKTDAVVWGTTYFMFHLDTAMRDTNAALGIKALHKAGRSEMFGEFTELTTNNNRTGRGALFGRAGSAGDAYRYGAETRNNKRSGDLRFDTGM